MIEKFRVGGQAVIEGVMMRSRCSLAIATRKRNGEIKIKKNRLVSVVERVPILAKPFFRGVVVLVEALVIGMKALSYSAQQQIEDEADEYAQGPEKSISRTGMILVIVFGLFLGILIFVVIPHLLTAFLGKVSSVDMGVQSFLFHLVDGILKITIFILYIYSISLMKDIQRVFQYHGAEHKSIHAYEAGQPLTPDSAKHFSTIHRRCGTAFILLVLTISIILFSVLFPILSSFISMGKYETHLATLLIKILLFIPIAGISYEIIKLGDNRPQNLILKALTIPGLWLQKMTTREPSDQQLEVALKALESVLEMEHGRHDIPLREEIDVR